MKKWFLLVLVGLALAVACSGRSKDSHEDEGKSQGARGGAGSSQGARGGSHAGEPNEGGEGGVPGPVGGTAGAPAGAGGQSGGTSPRAGSGGAMSTGGVAGVGVAGGGSGGVPFWWGCAPATYGDGVCDCGCAIPDPDCDGSELEDCERCNASGSCSGAPCPGRIKPDDPRHCLFLPVGWRCPSEVYADESKCDCGCGVPDPDCDGETRASCDRCNTQGSCARGECPSSIDPEDNTTCSIPQGWLCGFEYGDGVCNCGCGVVDVDCDSSSVDDCEDCGVGCSSSACPGTIVPDRNALCTNAPEGWWCNPRFYNDGSICHCGCGVTDLDCDSTAGSSCDNCNLEGSCSVPSCPGTIDPEFNALCIKPPPPPGWTCDDTSYGDRTCDCGCGIMDIDCRSNDVAECESCYGCRAPCPGRVDPSDITGCLPPPPEWVCQASQYGDNDCDCGCGLLDPDCIDVDSVYCDECPDGSCSRPDCSNVDATNNATCRGGPPVGWTCPSSYFGDGGCDCGCGAHDSDCASASRTVCEFCRSPGSCSTTNCPGTISVNDNSRCN